jgi:EAL domain-containing protein (putative c-di-GMP-specific phosphodiesterase class I)
VLAEACRQARAWQIAAAGAPAPAISVNVSGRQLYDDNFAGDVASILSESGLSPDLLILEVTESVLVSNHAAIERLKELRAMGIRIAIDDFGTGYSNLGYLQRFPVDILKIDRSFVMGVAEVGEGGFAHMIISLAAALKLRTVAEGIENIAQRTALASMGCGAGQGFLFSRPVVAADITAMLSAVPIRA